MRLVNVENLDVVSWQSIPEEYIDTFEEGVRWILEKDRQIADRTRTNCITVAEGKTVKYAVQSSDDC